MKYTILAFAALLSFVGSASAAPDIVVKSAIKIGGATSTSTFNTPTKSVIVVALNGAPSISGFQTAMQLEFLSEGNPVNVQNLKFTAATFTLVRNGTTVWNKTTFGAYHPVGQGTPDYLVYSTSGEVTPTGTNKWVTDWNGNSLGTIIPSASKFQVVNHPVGFNGSSRPYLATVGDYYTLWYELSFSYTYGEVNYNKSLVASDTDVMLLVTDGIAGYNSTSPSELILQVSDNLANWQDAQVSVPYPVPTTPEGIISLVPKTTNVSGLVSDRRFYRFRQQTLPGFP